uniref:Uncharacterized protein n=1 Tax=Meloidogyne enterolobii TaxID=390850 RepID=A0A6V7XT57_MELEN|nr:unnamed protein product [Meloidogyne enterolobii]
MGNTHPNGGGNYSSPAINTSASNSIQKSGKSTRFKMTEILGLRRQSTGNEVINSIKIKNNNYRSFTQSAHQSIEICEQFNSFKEENKIIKNNKNTSSLPQIEINGVNQEKEINEEKKHKAQKVDSRKIAAKKRLERGQTTSGSDNSSQNAKKSSFSERTLAKSLDNKYTDNNFLFDLKPLQSNIKCSPNHHSQQRLGSVGNVFGLINLNNRLFSSNIEINILNFEQSEIIQKTWLLANEKIRLFAGPDRSFALLYVTTLTTTLKTNKTKTTIPVLIFPPEPNEKEKDGIIDAIIMFAILISLTNNFNFLRIFIITTCFFIFLCFINIQTFIFSYNNYWIYT